MGAIEKILKQPGLGVQKVLILCGGPDWPTSVLTGILRLPVGQMLIGTLPCFILLMPAVLAGASLTEPDASKFSTILVMIVGMDGGLDGNVMNIIECPFGAGLLYAMIAGIFMYGLYTWLTRRHILRKQAFEARCASVTWSGAKMEVDDACRFSFPSIESFMSQR